jgi:phosphoesterase RecJ-like protein
VFKPIIDIINSNSKISIISHYNPDADAYGSSVGLAWILKNLGKEVNVYNESGIVDRYTSLPGIELVSNQIPQDADCLVVCDCGSINRVGDAQISKVKSAKKLINIDHHISNDNFAQTNLVVTNTSSTSEIIYELAVAAGWKLNTQAATCLMAGIVGDTGSFRYSGTSARTFEVAADLVKHGARPEKIFKDLYASPKLGAIKLQSESIANLVTEFDGQYAEILVTADMIAKHNASLDDTDGLAERARDIGGVKIGAAIRQDGAIWRISLRSVSEKYNVSDLASTFGGGGHKQAAAFRSSKPLDTVKALLREKVKEVLSHE